MVCNKNPTQGSGFNAGVLKLAVGIPIIKETDGRYTKSVAKNVDVQWTLR